MRLEALRKEMPQQIQLQYARQVLHHEHVPVSELALALEGVCTALLAGDCTRQPPEQTPHVGSILLRPALRVACVCGQRLQALGHCVHVAGGGKVHAELRFCTGTVGVRLGMLQSCF